MKLHYDWLKEFVSIPWPQAELAHRLSMAGLEVEGDEVNITPNRGDCLSILGLVREISALQGKAFSVKKTPPPKGEKPINNFLKVRVEDRKGCPRYMARAIVGVAINPSPAWLKKRLEEAGLRSINNVVDCTNYVMWELGHPLHAFDFRFLRDRQIVVRHEKTPTKFTTLDGETRVCTPSDLFICDGQGPVALAGIMGGQNSEVRDDTKEIVLEAAFFDPKIIHATAKRLKLSSESSTRFERGVDPNGVENALHRLCHLIIETAGGTPTKDWIDIYPKKITPVRLAFEIKEVERILGVAIPALKVKRLLQALGFGVEGPETRDPRPVTLKIKVPTYRFDISRPIDLIEEVVRLYGYDKIPATAPKIKVGVTVKPKEGTAYRETVNSLLGLGFSETCHLSFVAEKEAGIFQENRFADLLAGRQVVSLSNPLSEDQNVLRPSLMPNLLKAIAHNAHRQMKDVRLFELGKVFSRADGKVLEKRYLGLVAIAQEKPKVDFYSLKGALDQLAQLFHLKPFSYSTEGLPSFLSPHASASVWFDGKKFGWVGVIQPAVLSAWEMKLPVVVAEIDWEMLASVSQQSPIQYHSLPKFPFVERDIALVVDGDLPAKKIEEAVWQANSGLIEKVTFFDFYKGEGLPADKKSLAFHIRYASPERTLTNEEVTQSHNALVAHLEKTLPAKLR